MGRGELRHPERSNGRAVAQSKDLGPERTTRPMRMEPGSFDFGGSAASAQDDSPRAPSPHAHIISP